MRSAWSLRRTSLPCPRMKAGCARHVMPRPVLLFLNIPQATSVSAHTFYVQAFTGMFTSMQGQAEEAQLFRRRYSQPLVDPHS